MAESKKPALTPLDYEDDEDEENLEELPAEGHAWADPMTSVEDEDDGHPSLTFSLGSTDHGDELTRLRRNLMRRERRRAAKARKTQKGTD